MKPSGALTLADWSAMACTGPPKLWELKFEEETDFGNRNTEMQLGRSQSIRRTLRFHITFLFHMSLNQFVHKGANLHDSDPNSVTKERSISKSKQEMMTTSVTWISYSGRCVAKSYGIINGNVPYSSAWNPETHEQPWLFLHLWLAPWPET